MQGESPMQVNFCDPPRARSERTINHRELIQHLKERPGQWALVPRTYANSNSARSMAQYIKSGKSAYAPAGAFEAVTRAEEGVTRVWVRYIGDEEQKAA